MDSGEVAEDARLPADRDLADQYGVSRDTIRRAIQELANEGRLVVLHGRGRSSGNRKPPGRLDFASLSVPATRPRRRVL
jgi:DNA-binding FadR family transcriptional regulator